MVPDKPAWAWVACPGILHNRNLYNQEGLHMHCGDQRHAELYPAQAVGESRSHGTTLSASDIHNGLWNNFKKQQDKEDVNQSEYSMHKSRTQLV